MFRFDSAPLGSVEHGRIGVGGMMDHGVRVIDRH